MGMKIPGPENQERYAEAMAGIIQAAEYVISPRFVSSEVATIMFAAGLMLAGRALVLGHPARDADDLRAQLVKFMRAKESEIKAFMVATALDTFKGANPDLP